MTLPHHVTINAWKNFCCIDTLSGMCYCWHLGPRDPMSHDTTMCIVGWFVSLWIFIHKTLKQLPNSVRQNVSVLGSVVVDSKHNDSWEQSSGWNRHYTWVSYVSEEFHWGLHWGSSRVLELGGFAGTHTTPWVWPWELIAANVDPQLYKILVYSDPDPFWRTEQDDPNITPT